MDFFLNVEGRGGNHEVGPVLLVLPPPDELGVEVAVAAFVSDADRSPFVAVHDGLELGGGNVSPVGILVDKGFDLFFGGWFLFGHGTYW